MADSVVIRPAHFPEDIPSIKELFVAYAESLDFSLCFQGFDEELAELPGDYAPPQGALLAAVVNDQYAGCVALRPLEASVCEMKRLFIYDQYRGLKLGKQLAVAIVQAGKELGYTHMRLDTVPTMQAAIRLYRSLGFYDIPPYRPNPVEGTLYMEIDLRQFDSQLFG